MKNLQFPVKFVFKISSFSNDFTATDANNNTVAYVKQKLFKLKEDINIYGNESQTDIFYNIKADRWLDFSASYNMVDSYGTEIGKVARKGWVSFWKAEYELIDQNQQIQYHIREDNPWVKVMDHFLGEIPILGFFTGYFFNPSYNVTNLNGEVIAKLTKEPSFWGRKFEVTKLQEFDNDDDERIILGLMMMILLERRRG